MRTFFNIHSDFHMEKTVIPISCYNSTRSKRGNKGNNTMGKQEKNTKGN